MNGIEHGRHALQIGRLPAHREEQRLTLGLADPGVIEIEVNHWRFILEPDQEWAPRHHCGNVVRVPSASVEEQIFVLGEPEQRHREIVVGARFLAKEDRILALGFPELGRKDDHAADVVTELRRAARDHAQAFVSTLFSGT